MPLTKQVEGYENQLDSAKEKLDYLKQEMEAAQAAMAPGFSPEDYLAGMENLPQLQAAVKEQEAEIAKIQSAWESAQAKVAGYDDKIMQANDVIAEQSAKISELSGNVNALGDMAKAAMDKAQNSASSFGKKLLSIGKNVLVFNAIRSALRSVVNYTKKLLSTNDESKAQLAQLKGALMTAFQPIYNFILPGVMAVLRVLTAIVQVVASVLYQRQGADSSRKSAGGAYERWRASRRPVHRFQHKRSEEPIQDFLPVRHRPSR